jgi:hypothetical protein
MLGTKPKKKHYWLTPDSLLGPLDEEFDFDYDPFPYPRPRGFNSLLVPWGKRNWVNAPFSKQYSFGGYGLAAVCRKAVAEQQLGNTSVLVIPVMHFVDLLLDAGAEVRPAGRVRWLERETHEPCISPIPSALFVLRGKK